MQHNYLLLIHFSPILRLIFSSHKKRSSDFLCKLIGWLLYLMRCAIWYLLYNLKNMKKPEECYFYLSLQVSTSNFTKNNTPPWVLFTFLELYKWYQIAQSVSYYISDFINHHPFSCTQLDPIYVLRYVHFFGLHVLWVDSVRTVSQKGLCYFTLKLKVANYNVKLQLD